MPPSPGVAPWCSRTALPSCSGGGWVERGHLRVLSSLAAPPSSVAWGLLVHRPGCCKVHALPAAWAQPPTVGDRWLGTTTMLNLSTLIIQTLHEGVVKLTSHRVVQSSGSTQAAISSECKQRQRQMAVTCSGATCRAAALA